MGGGAEREAIPALLGHVCLVIFESMWHAAGQSMLAAFSVCFPGLHNTRNSLSNNFAMLEITSMSCAYDVIPHIKVESMMR